MSPRRASTRALIALAPPLIALALARLFLPMITPWMVFIAAVIIASWLGGLRSGLVAIALSIALIWAFLIIPSGRYDPADPRHFITGGLFVTIGTVVSVLHDHLRRASRKASESLEETRRANEALERAARERNTFAALIENSSDFIGIADATGKAIYLNPAGRRMVGLSPDFPVKDTQIAEYYPIDVRPFVTDVIVPAMLENGQWTGETMFRNWRTQASIPVWDTHFMINDPDTGQVIGMGTVTRDISAIRRAREQLEAVNRQLEATTRSLRESQQLLRAVFDHSPNAIVVKDLEGKFLLTNRQFERIMELTSEAVRGKTDYDLMPTEIADRHRATDHAAVAAGEPLTLEETGELKDGVHTFLETVFPLREEHGRAFGVCWIGTEITERKRSEETLRRTAADLKEAQRVAHLGSWAWDAKSDTLTWSEEVYRIHGRDSALAAPRFRDELPQLFTPEGAAALNNAVDKLMKDGVPCELELEAVLPDGSKRWVAMRGEAMRDASGQTVDIHGTTQDISALKHLQRMKEEWTSVIAHDLRQPIGVIKMSAELLPELHKGGIGEQEGAVTERIRSAANGLARMVDDLLDISRLETHRLSLDRVMVDPGTIVRQTLGRLAHITAGSKVTVTDSGNLPRVLVDVVRFEQVLGNLVSNAVKHGEKDGEIEVRLGARDAGVEIAVANRGKGIAPEDLSSLFTRFGRSKATRESGVPGLGLGLYIAKGLVEAHGGSMWVESIPNEKTTFYFTLPSRDVQREAA